LAEAEREKRGAKPEPHLEYTASLGRLLAAVLNAF
jgi:hypothetical protein